MSQPLNPYAAPQNAETLLPDFTGKIVPPACPYQSAQGKTTALLLITAATILLDLVLCASFAMQWKMLRDAQEAGFVSDEEAQSNDRRQQAISIVMLVVMIVCLIALLVWLYAVHANLPALGATALDFTPGWAVGWFFVPIANLVKPYQAVCEVWKNSDPALLANALTASTAVVGWWWGLRIVSAISGRIFQFSANDSTTIEQLMTVSVIAILLTLLIDVPMFVCQLLLVRKVQHMQNQRHEIVQQQERLAPQPAGPWTALS